MSLHRNRFFLPKGGWPGRFRLPSEACENRGRNGLLPANQFGQDSGAMTQGINGDASLLEQGKPGVAQGRILAW